MKLLGDELIGDDRLAVFELVKNSYDADATRVSITLDLSNPPSITVQDFGGCGMDDNDIIQKWMEVGTDCKRGKNRRRTKKLNRMPLGEKGVGRLAAHKLGKSLVMNTRAKGKSEFRVEIHWPTLIAEAEYITDTKVTVQKLNKPEYYIGNKTGTRIEIGELYDPEWSKRDLRRLKRLVTTLESPFVEKSSFDVELSVPGREKDLSDLLDAGDILDLALWNYTFVLDEDGRFEWDYNFNPPSPFRSLTKKRVSAEEDRLELLPLKTESRAGDLRKKAKNVKDDRLFLNGADLEGIGPIMGSFIVFSRSREVLNAQGAYTQIKDYLDEQTGVRIYRDGIRVYNYGEPNDDWLGLNSERINRPGERIGTDSIIGAVDLDLELSPKLTEKTNREGFDHNREYHRFRRIIKSLVEHFHSVHYDDRQALSDYIKGSNKRHKPSPEETFEKAIVKIRNAVIKSNLPKNIEKQVDYIEREYMRMREVAIGSGIAGINLAVVFHEVEREIDWFLNALKHNEDLEQIRGRVQHLSTLMEGFAPLLRKSKSKNFKASELLKKTIALSEHRFIYHSVSLSCPTLTEEAPDFDQCGPFGLLQASLSNLIDNALHWSRYQAELSDGAIKAAIQITTTADYFEEGPAIIVADNGPGFEIDPTDAVEPFKSTRVGGMGLGLYYVNMIMTSLGGKLIVLDAEDIDIIGRGFNGAAVVMLFKG